MNRQTAPECPTETVSDSFLCAELRDVAGPLLAEGFGVYYYRRDEHRRDVDWFIVERGGNVGTVQYDRLDGYSVTFAIKPSHETGSGLLVSVVDDGPDDDRLTEQGVVLAAGLATQDRYKNFATTTALPNHGWAHFEWAKSSLTRLAQEGEATQKTSGA